MKNILVAVLFIASLSINSAHAGKDTYFDMKHGHLYVGCIHVIGLSDYYYGEFWQRGGSSNWELRHAGIAPGDDCPPMLIEGAACEITKDVTGLVDVTFTGGGGCDDCTTTQVIEGKVVDGECVDLVG